MDFYASMTIFYTYRINHITDILMWFCIHIWKYLYEKLFTVKVIYVMHMYKHNVYM